MKRLLAVVIPLLLLLSGCGYNQIQKNEEAVFAAWGNVEATYQRRADLIPNLVETVRAYAAHERETLTEVTNARARVGQVQVSANDLNDPATQHAEVVFFPRSSPRRCRACWWSPSATPT